MDICNASSCGGSNKLWGVSILVVFEDIRVSVVTPKHRIICVSGLRSNLCRMSAVVHCGGDKAGAQAVTRQSECVDASVGSSLFDEERHQYQLP